MTSSDKRGIAWSVKNMAVRIPAGDVVLDADLTIEPDAKAIIVFAHGSGSGRYSLDTVSHHPEWSWIRNASGRSPDRR